MRDGKKGLPLNRTVQIIESSNSDEQGKRGRFADYLCFPNLILLGDPGAGKTHTFQAAAEQENVQCRSVRTFLTFAESRSFGEPVYLDGLDEFRSREQGNNLIIGLINLLEKQGRPSIRLSCRGADWLGESDLSLFKDFFDKEPYVVLNLEPLADEEITSILQTKNISAPQRFIAEVQSRNLQDLLKNPQTLIMLAKIVLKDRWPDTRKDLYEKFCQLLLTEHNKEHQKTKGKRYSPEDLFESAGEVAACLLISNIPGISLLEYPDSSEFPSYTTLGSPQKDIIQSCLMRRFFTFIDPANEAVSYIHRTIVEFLGACWLAQKIKAGHSILRIQSLIGIEGHPAPELRGLHAWLPVLHPKDAEFFIRHDPYGVLKYGDAASLSPFHRKFLLSELVSLSKLDPWFRAGNWTDEPLGSLSGPDMVSSFREILLNPNSSFHLRTIILDAICYGPPLTQMQDDLKRIIGDSSASYHERATAVDALLKVSNGDQELVQIYRSRLEGVSDAVQLRSKILIALYSDYFGPDEILSIVRDTLRDSEEHTVGKLYGLAPSLPETALPDILDTLEVLDSEDKTEVHFVNQSTVREFYSELLLRVLQSDYVLQAEQTWRWLKTLSLFERQNRSSDSGIDTWLKQCPDFVFQMLLYAYDPETSKGRWQFWSKFEEITSYSFRGEIFARTVLNYLLSKTQLSETDCFLYEICGSEIFQAEPLIAVELLENFHLLAKSHLQLQPICKQRCQCEIEAWRFKSIQRNFECKRKEEEKKAQNKINLEETKESIAQGKHLHNIGFLARVYYGLNGYDNSMSSIERFSKEVGDQHINLALKGFAAVLDRNDLPTPKDVTVSFIQKRYWPWWYAVLAGVNEAWLRQGKNLQFFQDKLLSSALALAIELPFISEEKTVNGWKEQILKERSDIAKNVLKEMSVISLARKRSHIPALSYIQHNDATKPWRCEVALCLLKQFPCTAQGYYLKSLLLTVLYNPAYHNELKKLAPYCAVACCGKERAIWLAVGFLLDPMRFTKLSDSYAKRHDSIIWAVQEVKEAKIKNAQGTEQAIPLSLDQIEQLILWTGRKFSNIPYPSESNGVRNKCDAAKFVRDTITKLSTIPDRKSGEALQRLLKNNKLSSYQDNLRHAVATQATVRREAEYRQPSWTETIEALKGGKPVNNPDLHALVFDILRMEKKAIQYAHTDGYKAFWRCNSNGNIDTPEIENLCRDRLIERLKPPLVPLGLHVEREGNMASDKRADILVLADSGMKLPLELKRHYHKDLWTACENQLERMYTRDPGAAGYGIYVVFWFGEKRPTAIPKPPDGINKPKSATELEKALQSLVPAEHYACIKVVVLDVTPPYEERSRASN